jgi:hypothetical protein
MIITMMSLSLIYQFWLHTETIDRMPDGLSGSSIHRAIIAFTTPQTSGIWIATTRRADHLGSPVRHV